MEILWIGAFIRQTYQGTGKEAERPSGYSASLPVP